MRGSIQVPPGGQPVLFLADHPVTGGYPVVAVVRDPDVDLAAQAVPARRSASCSNSREAAHHAPAPRAPRRRWHTAPITEWRMKITKAAEYHATPEQVFAVLSDKAFQNAKCAATAAIEHEATVEANGERTVITTERMLPSHGLPDFARSLVGPTLKVVETQDWGPANADGSREGHRRHGGRRRPDVPEGHRVASSRAARARSSTSTPSSRRRCPLIGGKIEKAAAPAHPGGHRHRGADRARVAARLTRPPGHRHTVGFVRASARGPGTTVVPGPLACAGLRRRQLGQPMCG